MSMRFGGSDSGSSGFGFGAPRRDEPEINLIPFIDVLLVVLIFLMLSTTYSKYTQLKINLPGPMPKPRKSFHAKCTWA